MKKTSLSLYSWSAVIIVFITVMVISCDKDNHMPGGSKGPNCADAKATIANWPSVSKEVAQTMMDKYGQPSGVTSDRLIWHNNGGWKQTIVFRDPVPHNFPTPHPDLLEQFIDYRVPVEKYDDMAAYDGSVIVERTKGVMSARCDKEGANFLAINLANDVATGKKTVDQARDYYTRAMKTFMETGQMDPYMKGFVFDVPRGGTNDPDVKRF